MATKLERRCVSITEPIPIDSEFASGPAIVRSIDGMIYLIFYTEHLQPPELGTASERVISKRLIIPSNAARRLWRMLDAALNGAPGQMSLDEFCDGCGHHALTA